MGRVKDSNSVLPGGSGWKRFIALGQNASTTTGSVGYQVLIMVSGNIWHCYLDGNSTNGYTLSFSNQLSYTDHTHDYLPISGGTLTGTLNANSGVKVYTNNKQYCNLHMNKEGTTSVVGIGALNLGNNAAGGTAGNARGRLILYSNNTYYVALWAKDDLSDNRNIYLPDENGTLLSDNGARDITIDGSHKLLLGSGSIYGSGTTLGFRPNNNDFTYGMNLWNANNTAWCLSPNATKMLNLGGPDYLWNTIYAFAGTIQTSDRREKHNIEDLEDNMIDFLMDLNPIIYRLNDKPEKLYSGLIAQDVEETMIEHNIPSDFGLLDKSPVYDEEENIIDYKYGLTYEQLIPILIKTIQNQEIRINKLEQLLKNKF